SYLPAADPSCISSSSARRIAFRKRISGASPQSIPSGPGSDRYRFRIGMHREAWQYSSPLAAAERSDESGMPLSMKVFTLIPFSGGTFSSRNLKWIPSSWNTGRSSSNNSTRVLRVSVQRRQGSVWSTECFQSSVSDLFMGITVIIGKGGDKEFGHTHLLFDQPDMLNRGLLKLGPLHE